MKTLLSVFLVLIGIAVASGMAFPTAAAAQPRGEKFQAVPCSTFEITADDFECGYVQVPEVHSQPDGKQLRLAVAILPRSDGARTGDAFVMAQGGPGGSTLDTFAAFFNLGYYPALDDLRAERDIVLYDQRGTLYSQPALMCPEELELTLETIDDDLTREEKLRQSEQAALECRARLVEEGVNLSAYNSIENARDIEAVRRALGYEKFDLYGISYGTLLALHGLRENPDTFRSVILDAVVPAQLNPNSAIAQSQQRAFERLFAACSADAECNHAYPNLKAMFYGIVDKLNARPARVPLTDSETNKSYHAVIDGDTFLDIFFQFIYNSEILPALPHMISDADKGRFTLIETYYPLVAFDRTFASGMYYSTMCAEDADFTPDELALEGVDPHIAASQARDTTMFLQLCEKWNVPQLGARADQPVTAEVPTLIFSGEFDPITPPPFGKAAGETIHPSYVFTFPAYGHGAMTSGNCPTEIIVRFIRSPEQVPDASCIARDAARVAFLTPATHLLAAGIGKLQVAMLQGKVGFFVVPILSILVLLTVWTIAPLAWLVRYAHKRPSEPQILARLAPWLAVLGSLIATAFFVVVFALVLIAALRNDNPNALVVGAPRAWLPVYSLPLLFTLCMGVFVAAVVLAWRRKNWEMWVRVYYSVLAVAALVLVGWFAWHGLILPGIT